MKGGLNTSGFTVIETMIVLGITAVILLSAMAVLSGKTSQQIFTQGINDVKTNLQQVINTSSNGSYPNAGTFSCTVTNNVISIQSPGGTTPPSRGQNQGCTFLGKLINFASLQGQPASQKYGVYTVVGLQCSSSFSLGCSAPTTWSAAGPYLLSSSTGTMSNYNLSAGLSIYSVTLTDTSNDPPVTYTNPNLPEVAFLANPATQLSAGSSITGTTINPGALQLSLYGYNGCSVTTNGGQLLPATASCALTAANEIDICFPSATTNQSGKLMLNGTGYQATVSLKIYGDSTC